MKNKQKAIPKLVLNIAIVGALITTYGGRKAYAGTCTETFAGSGVWTCSGPANAATDLTQTLTSALGGAIKVDTLLNFGITTDTGAALLMINDSAGTDISFTDTNNSMISGADEGIVSLNYGTGKTTIITTGMLVGESDDGILARNNGTDLNITAQRDIFGRGGGIVARNNGSGTTNITTTGTVTGDGSAGILVRNHGSSVSIDAQKDVTGGTGIEVLNLGTNGLIITVSGDVTGNDWDGINALSIPGNEPLPVFINQAAGSTTIGAVHGIITRNNNGSLFIDALGTTVGIGGDGMNVRNTGPSVTITSNVIAGDNRGIYASIAGGTGTIITTGTVTGNANGNRFGDGIKFHNSGSDSTIYSHGDISGGDNGIFVVGRNGATSITTMGVVTGDTDSNGFGFGIYASAYGTELTINTQGEVLGGQGGIFASNDGCGETSITTAATVAGDIDGNGIGDGITIYSAICTTGMTFNIGGDVTGGGTGIDAQHLGAGSLDITVSDVIVGTNGVGLAARTDGAGTGNIGISNINLSSGAIVSGGTSAIYNDSGASNVIVSAGAVVKGNVALGDGSDNLTFAGADFSTVILFDGGDDIDTSDGFTDILTFAGSSGVLTGANVINWEGVVIDIGTISFADAVLITGSLAVTNGGTLDNTSGLALTGDLLNTSILTMQDGDTSDSTTVTANYTGGGGVLNLDAVLGDETSASDTLVIAGDSIGNTTVNITNAGGAGAATVGDGILVVQVDGNSAGAFSLAGSLTAGDFEYGLVKVGNNWFLQSQEIDTDSIFHDSFE